MLTKGSGYRQGQRAASPIGIAGNSLAADDKAESAALEVLETPILDDLSTWTPDADFLKRFGIVYARSHRVIGFDREGQLHVAICDRTATITWTSSAVRSRRQAASRSWRPTRRSRRRSTSLTPIDPARHSRSSTRSIETRVLREVSSLASREDLARHRRPAPIIRLVNHLLFDAVKAGASDVHIQPYEDRVIVRQRIDGVLVRHLRDSQGGSGRSADARQSAGQDEHRRKAFAPGRTGDGATGRSHGRPPHRFAADQPQRADRDSLARQERAALHAGRTRHAAALSRRSSDS